MGHSRRTQSVAKASDYVAFATDEGGGGLLELEEANLQKKTLMADRAIRIILPLLPNGAAKAPVYYGISRGARFLIDVNNQGFEEAVKNIAGRAIRENIIPEVVKITWNSIEEQIADEKIERPLMEYAEDAYKSTMTRILNEGVNAL